MTRYIINLLIVGALFMFFWSVWASKLTCKSETIQSSNVIGSNLQIDIKYVDCGFGVSTGTKIEAVDLRTGSHETLAVGGDVGKATLKSSLPNEIEIALPNRSDIVLTNAFVDKLIVKIKYEPIDDAKDRSMYLAWVKNPTNDNDRQWYCTNVLASFPIQSKLILNQSLAQTYFPFDKSQKLYCN